MQLDFNFNKIPSSVLSGNQRRSIQGMIRSGFAGKADAVRFLEKKGIVHVDWTYHCQCGVCDPEPLVTLVRH